MPLFEYKCTNCNEKVTLSRSSDDRDRDLPSCKLCNSETRRVYSSVGVTFNGSGFYSTDKQKGSEMPVMTEEKTEEKQATLTLSDRCDTAGCPADALVKVVGVSGELLFCGHHYSKIESSEKLKSFAFEVVDERWTIQNENRLLDQ